MKHRFALYITNQSFCVTDVTEQSILLNCSVHILQRAIWRISSGDNLNNFVGRLWTQQCFYSYFSNLAPRYGSRVKSVLKNFNNKNAMHKLLVDKEYFPVMTRWENTKTHWRPLNILVFLNLDRISFIVQSIISNMHTRWAFFL